MSTKKEFQQAASNECSTTSHSCLQTGTSKPDSQVRLKINHVAKSRINTTFVNRLNQNSIFVLKASEQAAVQNQDAEQVVVEALPLKRVFPNLICKRFSILNRLVCFQVRLQEATYYEDLESNETNSTIQLNLSQVERYFKVPPTVPTVTQPNPAIGNLILIVICVWSMLVNNAMYVGRPVKWTAKRVKATLRVA